MISGEHNARDETVENEYELEDIIDHYVGIDENYMSPAVTMMKKHTNRVFCMIKQTVMVAVKDVRKEKETKNFNENSDYESI